MGKTKYSRWSNDDLVIKYLELSKELSEIKTELKKRIERNNGRLVTSIGIATFKTTHKYYYNIEKIITWLKRKYPNWTNYISIDSRKVKSFFDEWKKKKLVRVEEQEKKEIVIKEVKQ